MSRPIALGERTRMAKPKTRPRDRIEDLAFRALISSALALPYPARVRAMGTFADTVVAPLAGWRDRIRANLAHVRPDLPESETKRLIHAVPNNVGRTLIENYDTVGLLARGKSQSLEGDGLADLEAARRDGRPAILATGHFGNYEVPRAALVAQGYQVGALYRPMSNAFIDRHYAQTIKGFGGPVVSQGQKGTAAFIRALRDGRMMVLLFDLHVFGAPRMDFLGKPARTAVSAAKMALRHDALLIPFFGVRNPDGLTFRAIFDAPIPPSDPETMTAELNARLGARIDATPEQWFWIHRRWK
ncbi:MAG: lauroyl acyltransferase [Pseudomonadota bacterium]